jgi:25S rRNA (uracil2634-N3)-methyltransferase
MMDLQGGRNVTATCYDSKSELRDKYNMALTNADALETAGAKVYYNVDATALEEQPWIHDVERFNNVAFNFPHLGGATEADVEKNQQLLRDFFYSTRAFLHPSHGQVLVALRDTPFYNRWKIEDQAKISGFKLKRYSWAQNTPRLLQVY